MPKKLQKSLKDYLSKIKKPSPPPMNLPPNSFSASKSWILAGCKHPKTPSFAIDRNRNNGSGGINGGDSATLDDIDRFLFENFKSLYLRDEGGEVATHWRKNKKENERENTGTGDYILFESPRFINPPRDLCGSNRFFVAPGSSSSLMEEARSSLTVSEDVAFSSTSITNTTIGSTATTTSCGRVNIAADEKVDFQEKEPRVVLPDDCIAVLTHSSSPYDDFKRSMQEMVEARLESHAKIDWEFMEELLFCYLNLNEKKSFKYILSAFVDLVVVLRRNSARTPAKSRDVRSPRQRRKKTIRRQAS